MLGQSEYTIRGVYQVKSIVGDFNLTFAAVVQDDNQSLIRGTYNKVAGDSSDLTGRNDEHADVRLSCSADHVWHVVLVAAAGPPRQSASMT
eukprot:scaffold259317_cov16-Prasinocladus_malaysianus.AAC.1